MEARLGLLGEECNSHDRCNALLSLLKGLIRRDVSTLDMSQRWGLSFPIQDILAEVEMIPGS